ncbi:MAG TPA: hypothetical protein VME44_12150 [Streptosporangiaceae bacterium]|nr:hypothetical protein [Streptosporangiaceae bacterium]
MNDDELMTAVRESFTGVRSATAMERIVSRSRAVRAHRRVAAASAVGIGGAAAAAVAVSVALPGSHPVASYPSASHPPASPASGVPGVRLAAWTITRQADGSIQVTFREATHAAALQGALRADGVPVSVTFTGQQNPACRPYGASGSPAFWPFGPKAGPLGGYTFTHPKDAYNTPYALVIHPAALPSGAGLQIWTSGTPGAADNFQLYVGLVHASPQCTGS